MPRRKMIDLKEQLGGKSCLPKCLLHLGELMLGFDYLNRAHYSIDEDWDNGSTENFFKLACKYNNLRYDLNEGGLEHIPKEGACVIVSNHPHGFSDGLMFGDVAMRVRPDIRIVVNEFLDCVFGMRPYSIKVDVYGGKEAARANMRSMKEILQWLREGHCILVFPSGSVASYSHRDRRVIEDPWQTNIASIIRKTGASVVPMHIAGRTSLFFQAITLLSKENRGCFIPREILRDRKHRHQITLGSATSPTTLSTMETDEQLSDYLRLRTSLLSYTEHQSVKATQTPRQMEEIAPSMPPQGIIAEIEALTEDDVYYRSASSGLVVYMARAKQIPTLLQEIAIQREIIFRAVGEGTGKAFDRDEFDEYYGHLILWDSNKQQLAGAYRMGFSDEIIKEKGVEGLYASTFYKIDDKAIPTLIQGMDMGRAFIMPEYQRIPTSLDTLWMGIGRYMARHTQYRYLYGMVSVSAVYSHVSRSCIRSFLEQNKFNNKVAAGVKALAPATGIELKSDDCRLIPNALPDTKVLTQLINDLEENNQGIPVLLKHYLRLDGNAIGFSIDADFGNTLDCFFLVDMANAPERLKKRYLGEDCTL